MVQQLVAKPDFESLKLLGSVTTAARDDQGDRQERGNEGAIIGGPDQEARRTGRVRPTRLRGPGACGCAERPLSPAGTAGSQLRALRERRGRGGGDAEGLSQRLE